MPVYRTFFGTEPAPRILCLRCGKGYIKKLENAGHSIKVMVGEEFVKYYWGNYKVSPKWAGYVRKK